MKYQVGEKVKYDSGDWWFYGTITAVIENSICPSYRLNIERMVKKNCKFSITQFEFELEADNENDSLREKNKWENYENEYIKKINSVQKNDDSYQGIRKHVIEPKYEPEQKPEKAKKTKT